MAAGTQDQQFHMEALEELFMESVGTHMHAGIQTATKGGEIVRQHKTRFISKSYMGMVVR